MTKKCNNTKINKVIFLKVYHLNYVRQNHNLPESMICHICKPPYPLCLHKKQFLRTVFMYICIDKDKNSKKSLR